MKLKYLWFLFLFMFNAHATIFKCEKPNGSIKYQDLPCHDMNVIQTILDIPESSSTPCNDQKAQYKKQSEKVKKNMKTKQLQKNKIIKNKQKLKEREQKAELKKQQKCSGVQLKLKLLQDRLRYGYTVKQGIRLQEQIAHYQNLQQQYCN